MKQQLINSDAKELIMIMASLSESSERIAKVYHRINGGGTDMEEDPVFLQAQTSVNNAILKLGSILGTSIAEVFFCMPTNKIEVNIG